MELLLYVAALVIGGLSNLFLKVKPKTIHVVSIVYIYSTSIVSISYWIFYFSGLKNAILLAFFKFVIDYGRYVFTLLLGLLVVRIQRLATWPTTGSDASYAVKLSKNVVLGLSILTSNIFLVATVGKIENFGNMSSFFISSGYSVKFLYFIMIVESLGGLGILLNFKLRTGPVAAAGLICIMIGAVYTHWHNHDPFSDSYAAVMQLTNLLLLQALYYSKKLQDAKWTAQGVVSS